MAAKIQTIVGLDIGSSNVKVVAADVSFERDVPNVNIVGVGNVPSRGMRKGLVINLESTVEAISAAVEKASVMCGLDLRTAYTCISISGEHIEGMNQRGLVKIGSSEVTRADIERVIDSAKAVQIPSDREILHVFPQEFILDGQTGIKNPLGMPGVRLEANVHMVVSSVRSNQNIVKCANHGGLGISDIILGPIASASSVVTPEEKELGVCMIDIGGGTSDIVVYNGGTIRYTSVIPVGGERVTGDIASILVTPIRDAEHIKKQYGTVRPLSVRIGETIDVPATGGRPSMPVERRKVAEIMSARVSELLKLVRSRLIEADCFERLDSGIVLTGGTANMNGITELAEEIFKLPVRVGVDRTSGLVEQPEYAAATGLVRCGAEAMASGRLVQGGRFMGVLKSVGNWFGRHF